MAGKYPLDPLTVRSVGRELGAGLLTGGAARVVVGRDTRVSGRWIEDALAGGLEESGAEAVRAGVFPTPGISFLTRSLHFQAGVVISASHNPYRDNGIKIMGADGRKLPDAAEKRLEERLQTLPAGPVPVPPDTVADGAFPADEALMGLYRDFLRRGAGRGRLRIVIDCANGAGFRLGPETLASLGYDVHPIHHRPDGTNINRESGATHPDALAREVVARGADLGVALDGDGDRAIFADASGTIVDGDHVLFLLACYYQEAGRLAAGTVVTTVMANLGLELALRERGIAMERTAVGDRHVLERMLEKGAVLGGEQSGHILMLHRSVAGDGILTALEVLHVLEVTGERLDRLAAGVRKLPQVLLNVPVARRTDLDAVPPVAQAVRAARQQLGEEGRVLVRYSGTEPLVRVMVEAADPRRVRELAGRIAQVIQDAIG